MPQTTSTPFTPPAYGTLSVDGKFAKNHGVGLAYRYGFNNMEKDDELKGTGNSYDFGARNYDSRIGRWLAVDPWSKYYVSWSPYNGFNNNPIVFDDPNGKGGRITIKGTNITIEGKIYVYRAEGVSDEQIKQAFEMHGQDKKLFSQTNDVSVGSQTYSVTVNVEVVLVSPEEAKQLFEANNQKKAPDPTVNFFEITPNYLNSGASGRGGEYGDSGQDGVPATNYNIGAFALPGLINASNLLGLVLEEFWHTATGGYYPIYQKGDNVYHNNKEEDDGFSVCDGRIGEGLKNHVRRHDLFRFLEATGYKENYIHDLNRTAGSIAPKMFEDKSKRQTISE